MSTENQELRKAGLKVTLPRVKILQILESVDRQRHHMSAEDVYRALLESGEDVGLATVYRVLTQFESAGLVVRHNFEGGHSVFELAAELSDSEGLNDTPVFVMTPGDIDDEARKRLEGQVDRILVGEPNEVLEATQKLTRG